MEYIVKVGYMFSCYRVVIKVLHQVYTPNISRSPFLSLSFICPLSCPVLILEEFFFLPEVQLSVHRRWCNAFLEESMFLLYSINIHYCQSCTSQTINCFQTINIAFLKLCRLYECLRCKSIQFFYLTPIFN